MEILVVPLLAALLVALVALGLGARREARRISSEVAAIRRTVEEHAERPVSFPPPPDLEPLRDELAGRLREVADRVEAVERAIGSLPRPEPPPAPVRVRVAEEVGPLLREAMEVLEARIAEVRRDVRDRQDDSVAETIVKALRARGFEGVVIVDGPESDGGRTRATVEARRHGMIFKGSVLMDGARMVDLGLKPATAMFP
ncbi:MAG: hypothetical protein MUE73_09540 [Planctomycetes bacterium]|nr:hypothetical protein [Planctomycetota bacterium]